MIDDMHPDDIVLRSFLDGLYADNEQLPVLIGGPFSLTRDWRVAA